MRVVARTLVLLAICCGAPAGCVSSSSGPRFVGKESLDRIEKGATRDEWIVAVLGKPTVITTLAQGQTQIWKYPYEPVDKDKNRLRLVDTGGENPPSRAIYVQLANGVVTDWWRD